MEPLLQKEPRRSSVSATTWSAVQLWTGIKGEIIAERFQTPEDVPLPPIDHPKWAVDTKRILDAVGAALLTLFFSTIIPAIPFAIVGVMTEGLVRWASIRLGIIAWPSKTVPMPSLRHWINPFYSQTRVGENDQDFQMWKFRSMIPNAHELQAELEAQNERPGFFKMARDPRTTIVGRILRMTSIDEMAQFLNVLSGTMTLIGPRPHLRKEWDAAEADPANREILREIRLIRRRKPGISGMASTHGRDKNSLDKEIELEINYIYKWSLLVDERLKILTALVMVERPLQSLLEIFRIDLSKVTKRGSIRNRPAEARPVPDPRMN